MNTLIDLIDLGGHGLYVWGSLAMCAAVVTAELLMLRLRRHLLRREASDAQQIERLRERAQ
jgi:heme exporter protein D